MEGCAIVQGTTYCSVTVDITLQRGPYTRAQQQSTDYLTHPSFLTISPHDVYKTTKTAFSDFSYFPQFRWQTVHQKTAFLSGSLIFFIREK